MSCHILAKLLGGHFWYTICTYYWRTTTDNVDTSHSSIFTMVTVVLEVSRAVHQARLIACAAKIIQNYGSRPPAKSGCSKWSGSYREILRCNTDKCSRTQDWLSSEQIIKEFYFTADIPVFEKPSIPHTTLASAPPN